MTATPYPLPRELRETAVLSGNGGDTYGPFAFKIFDIEDVTVLARADGETFFAEVEVTTAKTTADAYSFFTVTFDDAVPATTDFVVRAERTAERSIAVTRDGSIRADMLEKELSKQASAQSELRRDVDGAVRAEPGATPPRLAAIPEGHFWKADPFGNMVDGGDAGDIEGVQEAAAAATAAAALALSYAASWGVGSRTALAAVIPSLVTLVYLNEGDRSGWFRWRAGNFAAIVAIDTMQGHYVASSVSGFGTTVGCWVRDNTGGTFNVEHFGAQAFVAGDQSDHIQCALDVAGATGIAGGKVLVPRSYQVAETLFMTKTLVSLSGVGRKKGVLTCIVGNRDVIAASAAKIEISDLTIIARVRPTTTTAGIRITGGVQVLIDRVDGYGCAIPLAIMGASVATGPADVRVRDSWFREPYGTALCYLLNCGYIIFDNVVFDHPWPVTTPAIDGTNDKGAHATSTAYSVNDFVTLSTVLLQCATAGTSDSVAPDTSLLQHFGAGGANATLTDGTVVWRLANNIAGSSLVIDSGTTFIYANECDFTGAFKHSIHILNNVGGELNRADVVRIAMGTFAGTWNAAVELTSFRRVQFIGCEAQAPVGASGQRKGIEFASTAVGDLLVDGCAFKSTWQQAIELANASGGTARIVNSQFENVQAGVKALTGVDDFIVHGNVMKTCTTGVDIAAGCDNFAVTGNNLRTCTTPIADLSTGFDKHIHSNIGA